VRTPQGGAALQVHLDMVDSLGFTSTTVSGLVDGSAAGSSQDYWIGQADNATPALFVIDALGAPGVVYDFELDIKVI